MPNPTIWPVENVTDTFFTVTSVSQICLILNQNRADADFTNDSDCVIYLARGNLAVVGSGIRLNPNGGSYHIGTNNMFEDNISAVGDCEQEEECNLAISEGNRP